MQLTPVKKNIAVIAVCFFAFGASVGVFAWLAQSVAREVGRREAIVARIAELAGERAGVRAVSLLSEERAADLERIRKFYVSRSEPVAFVEALEAAAKNTGNRITLAVDDGAHAGANLVFRATLDGTQGSVIRFVRALEHLPYLVHAQEISFQHVVGDKSGGSGARMIVIIRARTL